ncbi:MAG: methyltransferase domain-containing protein [Asticcacaulis sp.]
MLKHNMRVALGLLVILPFAGLATATWAQTTPAECVAGVSPQDRLDAILAHMDRPESQTKNDEHRRSETQFVLPHIKSGDHVLDVGAGGGYATMLLSAAVCDGTVDSQNPKAWVEGFKIGPQQQAMVAARPNIHLVTADFDSIPMPATPYDVIFIGTVYHDTNNVDGHDMAKQDKNLLSLLKPGGLLILTDHNTAAGVGDSATNTLHRIEKAKVIADFTAAGFELAEDSDALANPEDDHSKNVFDPSVRGKTDRMALVFKRPL